MRNIISEYRKKKALLKKKYGISPTFGESNSRFAHRVAIRKLASKGVDMIETQAEVMRTLGWRLETEDEQIERIVKSEVKLAKRQKIHKSRYFGDEDQMIKDIREAVLVMNNLGKPKWVKE